MITNMRLVECRDECVLGMNRLRSLYELNGPEHFQPWKGWKGGHKPPSLSVRTRMNTPQICRKTQDGNAKKMYCHGLKEGPWICIPEVELQAVRRAPGSSKHALSAMSNTHIIVPSQRVSVCICSLHAILPTATTTKTTRNRLSCQDLWLVETDREHKQHHFLNLHHVSTQESMLLTMDFHFSCTSLLGLMDAAARLYKPGSARHYYDYKTYRF